MFIFASVFLEKAFIVQNGGDSVLDIQFEVVERVCMHIRKCGVKVFELSHKLADISKMRKVKKISV